MICHRPSGWKLQFSWPSGLALMPQSRVRSPPGSGALLGRTPCWSEPVEPSVGKKIRRTHPGRDHQPPHRNHARVLVQLRRIGLLWSWRRRVGRRNTLWVLEALDGGALAHPDLMQARLECADEVQCVCPVHLRDEDEVKLADHVAKRHSSCASCSSCSDIDVGSAWGQRLITSGRGGHSTRPSAHASTCRTRSSTSSA